MSAPTVSVGIDLGIPNAGEFILDTSELDGPDVLGTGVTTVTNTVNRVSIRRGRTGRLIDPIDAGSCSIVMNNEDRSFDPDWLDGPYWPNLVPSRGVTVEAGGVRIFTGFIEDWDLDYDVSGRSTAAARCTDALGILGQCSFTAWTNTATTGARKLSNICDRPEVDWPAHLRWFDDQGTEIFGAAPLQSDNVSWGSNALNYCQLIARSELLSLFFAMADGVLRYRSYLEYDGVGFTEFDPPLFDVSFGGTGIPFQEISRRSGSEMLFSSVSVDREDGIAQTATVSNTATWQNTYGRLRRLSIPETLLRTDALALVMAEKLRDYCEVPRGLITEISVELASLSAPDQTAVLEVEIGDHIEVTLAPNGVGTPLTRIHAVQGITHDIAPESHMVTFSLFRYPNPQQQP